MLRFFSGVSTGLLSRLRKETSASISLCKKALENNGNDYESALSWLEKESLASGLSKLTKNQARETTQGVISFAVNHSSISIIKLACETDFASKSSSFTELASHLAKTGLEEKVQISENSLFLQTVAKLGENINIKYWENIPVESFVGSYVHNRSAPFAGPKVSIVSTSLNDDEFNRRLAQHVLVNKPTLISGNDETCLMNQPFLFDPSITVGSLLQKQNALFKKFIVFEMEMDSPLIVE